MRPESAGAPSPRQLRDRAGRQFSRQRRSSHRDRCRRLRNRQQRHRTESVVAGEPGGTVSVGNVGYVGGNGQTYGAFTRRIVNVAAGASDNDAVNVGQLNSAVGTLNGSIAGINSSLTTLSTRVANLPTGTGGVYPVAANVAAGTTAPTSGASTTSYVVQSAR